MSPLTIFTGPYGALARIGLIAIAGFGIWIHGWYQGNEHGGQKLVDYQAKQATADTKLMAARLQVVTRTETKWRTEIREVKVAGETIEKEVTRYVTKEDDAAAGSLPVGWVREFNAAWSGTPAGPPAESDRGPSGNTLSAVATVNAGNATTCRIWKKQRDGLIAFYEDLRKLDTALDPGLWPGAVPVANVDPALDMRARAPDQELGPLAVPRQVP